MSISASAQKLPRGNFSYATSLPATPDITVSPCTSGPIAASRRRKRWATCGRRGHVGPFAPRKPTSGGRNREQLRPIRDILALRRRIPVYPDRQT